MKTLKYVRTVLQELSKKKIFTNVPYEITTIIEILETTHVDKITITPKDTDLKENVVLGRYRRYSESAVYGEPIDHVMIDYASSMNLCWTRFVIAKELCHIFLNKTHHQDNGRNGHTVTEKDLSKLVAALSERSEILTVHESPAVRCEILAEHFACELLFPFEFRLKYRDAYNEAEVTNYELATLFRIPETIVNQIMSDEYFDFIHDIIEAYEIPLIEV